MENIVWLITYLNETKHATGIQITTRNPDAVDVFSKKDQLIQILLRTTTFAVAITSPQGIPRHDQTMKILLTGSRLAFPEVKTGT